MRIISSFRDYYDGVQGAGFDDRMTYRRESVVADSRPPDIERKAFQEREPEWRNQFKEDHSVLPPFHFYRPEVLQKPDETLNSLADRRYWRGLPAMDGVLYFCGRAYPFWSAPHPGSLSKLTHSFEDGFDALIQTFDRQNRYLAPHFDPMPYREWLSRWWGAEIDPALHFHHRSPVVLYRGHRRVIDPRLRDIHFQRVVDAYTAFQEIDMFLGGVLAETMEPSSPLPDKAKIQTHGMDPKWSFRKPPGHGA